MKVCVFTHRLGSLGPSSVGPVCVYLFEFFGGKRVLRKYFMTGACIGGVGCVCVCDNITYLIEARETE